MPRATRTTEEVDQVKEDILEAALQVIVEEGFQNLSMRNIADKLGMTAANIYNYYTNKDELYILIRTRGFDLFYEYLNAASQKHENHHDRLRAMIQAYIDFSISYPGYYDIMFIDPDTPKFNDYFGTEMEPLSFMEKQTALKSFYLVFQTILQYRKGEGCSEVDAMYKTIQLWCDMNGMVSLYNSRLLHEVVENVDEILELMVSDMIKRYIISLENGKSF
jgi:AcrR family transcriptional regulator